jgi:UDP-N-acetylglucosamine acyltransferase
MSSHSALGGHVHIGNKINIGWSAGVHQFCQVGDYAMVAACSKLTQDVPPFVIADGNPAETKMVNKVGLLRNGFSEAEVDEAKTLHRTFYRDGLNATQALEKANTLHFANGRIAKSWLGFVRESKRGLA